MVWSAEDILMLMPVFVLAASTTVQLAIIIVLRRMPRAMVKEMKALEKKEE